MDAFSLVSQSREAATIAEFLPVIAELRRQCHVLPKKSFFVFSLVSRRVWFIHSKGSSTEPTAPLWNLMRELVFEFDPIELDSVKDDLIRLVFHELELGPDQTKEAVFAFVSAIEGNSKLRDSFRVDYDVAVGGRKSPSFSAALKSCQDGRLWAPLLRLIEVSAMNKIEKGMSTYDRLFHVADGEQSNLIHLLKCGSVSHRLLLLAMFPVLSKESSRRAARKSSSSFSQSLSLLSSSFTSHPQLVAPFLPPVVNWCCSQWPAADAITVLQHLQALLASPDHEQMQHLVLATRELADKNWTRDWSWKVAAPVLNRDGVLSEGALKTLAAVVAVAPTVCFKLMDQRVLFSKVAPNSQAAASLMCALVSSHASLRALPDLLASVCSASANEYILRSAFELATVRSAARDALRACLPSTAKALSLVPRDQTSSIVVSDILKWGPVSEESKHSGWKPMEWAAKIAQFAVSSCDAPLMESLMSAIHYRWDPLSLMEAYDSGFFGLRKHKTPLLGAGMQLRLARDFPTFWSRPSNSEELSWQEVHQSAPDWAAVLWGGGDKSLFEWLIRGPVTPHNCALAWKPPTEGRAAQVVFALTNDAVDAERKKLIADQVPLELLQLFPDSARVVQALINGQRLDKLAKLVELDSKCKKAAKSLWLKSNVSLGCHVAKAIDAKRVWKKAMSLPRPQVWQYVAEYSKIDVCLDKLMHEGLEEAGIDEPGCADAWIHVLGRVSESDVKSKLGGDVASKLFERAWRRQKWSLLEAFHACLLRVGLNAGAHLVMHKSLCLVLKFTHQQSMPDSFISKLLHLAEYKMALEASKADSSGRLLSLLLQLPTEDQDRSLLRSNVPALLSLANLFPRLKAAACCERLIRLCPPYDVTQFAFYLQLVRLDSLTPETPDAPEIVCYAMSALEAARRAAPSLWFRGAGLVAAFEQRAMELLASGSGLDWERAARALGREIGGGGADLKQRKYYLAFALGDWLSGGETRASLGVRNGVWQEGLVTSMESCVTENDLAFSYSMVRGSNASKAAWKRYKRRYEEMDKYTGKV